MNFNALHAFSRILFSKFTGNISRIVTRVKSKRMSAYLLTKTQLMVYGSRQMVAKLPECFRLSLLGKELIPKELKNDV